MKTRFRIGQKVRCVTPIDNYGGHPKKMHVYTRDDARERLQTLLETGEVVDEKKKFNFYPTPDPVIELMMQFLDIFGTDLTGKHCLEPSAGDGRIVRHLLQAGASVDAVEVNPYYANPLSEDFKDIIRPGIQKLRVRCDDFLTMTPGKPRRYDYILMNPPFANTLDIEHVEHARRFLRAGGQLAAVVPAGPRQTQHYAYGGENFVWHILPEGTFRAEGTNVSTAIVAFHA